MSALLIFSVCITLFFFGRVGAEDGHESCEFWAQNGECESNPVYMMQSCGEACARFGKTAPVLTNIYEIEETDIHDQPIHMSQFKDKVLYIVNVASYCGYTAEGYELLRNLRQYRAQGLETIIAPCNQFGYQEPGDFFSIKTFAEKQSFDGIILSKKDVNGPDTRPLFAHLKAATGKHNIDWNFDGKFLVSRDGQVTLIEPHMDVEAEIRRLLEGSSGAEL